MVVSAVTPFVADHDFTLYVGDVRDVLATLPDGSVDCVVCSPPYWGLRDYGTGQWAGGNPECDHNSYQASRNAQANPGSGSGAGGRTSLRDGVPPRVCKCGATRTDQQLGLEPTPDEYVASMVAVFREVRRVLAPYGTCWVNLGDSYASSPPGNVEGVGKTSGLHGANDASGKYRETLKAGHATKRSTIVGGLKPKDLVGIPWRVAFALQDDGWYLRSDIVWSKPNPMPESVTDRPTKAHEYVFLLSKGPRYFFDQEAVREKTGREADPEWYEARKARVKGWTGEDATGSMARQDATARRGDNNNFNHPNGRNIRSVWEIATQPYAEAHFATYPEALVERCLKAGCPEWVCGSCGKPRERLIEVAQEILSGSKGRTHKIDDHNWDGVTQRTQKIVTTLGWSDCGHNNYWPGVVLDPFMGSGTTALVARRLGRHAIGVELNPEYAALCARRLQQLTLPFEATL